jgi:hypothetical protein
MSGFFVFMSGKKGTIELLTYHLYSILRYDFKMKIEFEVDGFIYF